MSADMTRFQIGDKAWRATFDSTPAFVQCPDCCGSGRLRVIMGDDTIVSIDCQNCTCGHLGPRGVLRVYERTPRAELVTIIGVAIDDGRVEYRAAPHWLVESDDLFDNEADALARAKAAADRLSASERERIASKEKDTRSWAWNASYHRGRIRQAQKDIEYHTSKLTVAALKAKAAE